MMSWPLRAGPYTLKHTRGQAVNDTAGRIARGPAAPELMWASAQDASVELAFHRRPSATQAQQAQDRTRENSGVLG